MRTLLIILMLAALGICWKAGAPRASPTPAQPAPADVWEEGPHAGSVSIPRGPGGHFFVGGDVANVPLRLVVDTGATSVAMSVADATKIGLAPQPGDWTMEAHTAGGIVKAAPIVLPRLRIGEIQLRDVRATVIDQPDMPVLLGQSFLARLDSVSIRDDRMLLEKY